MRKAVIVSSLTCLLSIPTIVNAERYFSVGGGAGGKADAANLSLEVGGVTTNREHDRLLAFGVGIIFNGDDVPSDTLEYPVPHWNYTDLGTKQDGPEIALFGKYGLEVITNKRLFLFGLGGLSFAKEIELAQSNATGWYYEQSSSSKLNGVFGAGLSYFPPESKVSLSVEYDNRRGITGSLGYRF